MSIWRSRRTSARSGENIGFRGLLHLAAAALAPLVLTLACSAAAPPPSHATHPPRSTLPRLSWRPHPGTTGIDCGSPSYDCDKVGLEKCESECAEGEMPDCVALAEWHDRGPAKGGNPARGLALLRLACDKGFGLGCVALAAHPAATPRDQATVTATLGPRCTGGELCGCALYGDALTLDPKGSVRGIELLSDSCGRGAIDACDSLSLIREICERDHSHAEQCARIQADFRPRWAPTRWPWAELPAPLHRCFRVAEQLATPSGERCVPVATAEANGWSKERGYVCPDDGSFDPGALYCFVGDRYFVKPPRAPWDEHPGLWVARPDQTVFRLRLVHGNDGDGEWFAADQGYLEELRLSGGEILAGGDGVAARFELLSAPEEQAARAAVAALPTIEEACARAYRCSTSIYPWTNLERALSLRACVEREDSTRVIVEKTLGSDAAKEACP